MTDKFTKYDITEDLDTPEAIALFMTDALETGDAGYIAHALGIVARAHGMSEIARKAGVNRESLYRTLSSNGNPSLTNFLAVMRALDIDLNAVPNRHVDS